MSRKSSDEMFVCTTVLLFLVSATHGKPDGCGIRDDIQQRIVGGVLSSPGKWPWMAALYRTASAQYCAGALISDRHVLTAAHCISGVQAPRLHVRLGDSDIKQPDSINTSSPDFDPSASNLKDNNNIYGVEKIVIHQKYDARLHLNDIAVLRLDRTVRFTPLIQRICLPPPTLSSLEDSVAVVAGWGTTSFLGSSSSTLREVEVPIWSNADCLQAIGKNVFNTTLCAGGKEKSADSCQGDSGGPLMMAMTDDRWAAVGIVSWGIRCGEPNKPGLYTRTSQFTDWILSAVQRS